MDRTRSLALIEREAGRILSLVDGAGAGATNAVPSCPGWTLEQIPDHLGRVYAMVTTVLQGDPDSPPDRARIPHRPEAQPPTAWMRERLGILLPLLRDIPEDARCWNFATGPGPVDFWWRRQLHETLIHRVDAELAAGQPVTGAEPDVAADGIGDLLVITRQRRVEPGEIDGATGLTVHLHATDAGPGAEWTIDTTAGTYACAHRKGGAAFRGSAWALDLWCWRRQTAGAPTAPGGLEAFGDVAAAEAWRPSV